MRRQSKQRARAWVLPLVLLLVAGGAFALLRGNNNPSLSTFAPAQPSQANRQARTARGVSAVLPAPKGWSPGRE